MILGSYLTWRHFSVLVPHFYVRILVRFNLFIKPRTCFYSQKIGDVGSIFSWYLGLAIWSYKFWHLLSSEVSSDQYLPHYCLILGILLLKGHNWRQTASCIWAQLHCKPQPNCPALWSQNKFLFSPLYLIKKI